MRGDWKETTATVWSFIPGTAGVRGSQNAVIISYQVDGEQYSSEICTSRFYVKGQEFGLKYDPKNPERNELSLRSQLVKKICIALLLLLVVLVAYYQRFRPTLAK